MITTYSTHDDVVNIVRRSGGTLVMKVITPVIKPKSVSQQIKNHMTPTPNIIKKQAAQDSPKPPKLSKAQSHSILESPKLRILGGETQQAMMTITDKETVIGEISPAIPRKGAFEWGEESPSITRRIAAENHPLYTHERLSPVTGSPSTTSPSRSKSSSYMNTSGHIIEANLLISRQRSPLPTTYEEGARKLPGYAVTLPANLQPPNLSDFASTESQDEEDQEEEEEEESSFAAALKRTKEKIQRKSSVLEPMPRQRARTMPSTPPRASSPLVVKKEANNSTDGSMSPLQVELLRANKERRDRAFTKQPKITEVQKTNGKNKESKRSSLTKALSVRLDSMNSRIKSPDSSDGSDFDDSPGIRATKITPKNGSLLSESNSSSSGIPVKLKTPPAVKPKSVSPSSATTDSYSRHGIPVKPKAPPPTVRPKPSKKKMEQPNSMGVDDNSETDTTSEVRLSPAPKKHETDFNFKLPLPLEDHGEKRLSFVDLAPPEAFKLDESPPLFPTSHPPPPAGLLEEHYYPIPPPPPITAPPSKLASTAAEVFVFSVDEDQEKTEFRMPISSPIPVPTSVSVVTPLRPNPTQISRISSLPSPIVNEKVLSSGLSSSPLLPPVFSEPDGFWVNDSSDDIQANLPPFSPQSTVSELSDAPPPLPSEPPPLLDSDASSEQYSMEMGNVVHNGHAKVPSSAGSSPLSYDVTIPDFQQEVRIKEVELKGKKLEESGMGIPSEVILVVPEVAKKTQKGFVPLEAEQVYMIIYSETSYHPIFTIFRLFNNSC